ncbi:MAG: glycosyltransferase [Anaerolineaceae bacterium]|nr:glycosyltransferase [Anaerolineaceae bacterium]
MNESPRLQNKKKRIVILTYGSRGDVEPFVALGHRLILEGYSVCLVAPKPFSDFIQAYGLEFYAIESDPDELGQMFANQAGTNWFKMISSMAQHVMPIARNAFQTIKIASQDADMIIHSFLLTDAGHTLALQQSIPEISAQFFPVFLPTGAFPAVALPDLPLEKMFRRGMHTFNTGMFKNGARFTYKKLRKTAPELPELASWPFSGPIENQPPILFAYSQYVLPHPDDWPANAHVTGYWQLPIPADWSPPQNLTNFIREGSAPIYFGPGSMRSEKLHILLEMVITAARKLSRRVVLGVASDDIPASSKGKDIISAKGVPHCWLFPQMSYIMHHGGAGTTGSAVASGVPNSAIPFSVDQSFWAKRLYQLGVGPTAPSAKRITQRDFERIIRDGLENPDYRHQAGNISEKMKKEDGIGEAIRIIKDQFQD